ncbi:MAG: Uma2 family endonuclease [Gemmatimonadota bacterium]
MAMPDEEGYRIELSGGRLVREPAPGPRHGNVAIRIASLLHRLGQQGGHGLAFVDTAFTLARDPATIRVPDVAFVSRNRVPESGLGDEFWQMAPDLAVEILSPSNSSSEIQKKSLEYLEAGARIVWIVEPGQHTVTILRSRSDIRILTGDETLDGGDVLPGLEVRVGDLFDPGRDAQSAS